MEFERVCYRHGIPFESWRNGDYPICFKCGADDTAPIWWIVNDERQRIGWAHVFYCGCLVTEAADTTLDEVQNLPLGLGCRLPSGAKATIWAKRPVHEWRDCPEAEQKGRLVIDGRAKYRIGTDVEVIREGRRVTSRWLRGGLMVEPLPEFSPHKGLVRKSKKAKTLPSAIMAVRRAKATLKRPPGTGGSR